MSSRRFFFSSTAYVNRELGAIQTFVYSSLVAQWNLRIAVKGYVSEVGNYDHYAIQNKFVQGSGLKSVDLSHSCLDQSWAQQTQEYAKFLLLEVCTFYEAWLEAVIPKAHPGPEKRTRELINWLQIPSRGITGPSGVAEAIRDINLDMSPLLKNEYFPTLAAHPKNSWSVIDNNLRAYRAFKEMRNSLIHQGGIATERAETAFTAMSAIPFADLGLKHPFAIPTVIKGQPIILNIDDVKGFANIVTRIIVTLDAALAVSKTAENDLIKRLREHKTNNGQPVFSTLPIDPIRRQQRLCRLVGKILVPTDGVSTLTEQMLLQEGFAN